MTMQIEAFGNKLPFTFANTHLNRSFHGCTSEFSVLQRSRRYSVDRFEQPRRALSAANTHGHNPKLRLPPGHLVGHGPHHARAGHAKRMPDRDGSTVDVELFGIETQTVAAVDHLHRE